MHANTTTTTPTAPTTTTISPATPQQTAAQKLERTRARLRAVARDVAVSEGRLLDFETADEMQRALHTSLRELEELSLTLAVLERRTR